MNKALKWFFIVLGASFGLAILGLIVFAQFYLSPLLKNLIEEKGSAALGAPLTVGSVAVDFIPPFGATASELSFAAPDFGLSGNVAQTKFETDAKLSALLGSGALGNIRITLTQPNLELEIPESETEPSPPNNTSDDTPDETSDKDSLPEIAREIGLEIKIIDGTLFLKSGPSASEAIGIRLEQLQFEARASSLSAPKGDLKLLSQASVQMKSQSEEKPQAPTSENFNLNFPLALSFGYTFSEGQLGLSDLKGEIFRLAFQGRGQQDFNTGIGSWAAQISAQDLAALPVPPSFLPPGKWGGKIFAAVQAESKGSESGWQGALRVQAQGVKGETEFRQDDLQAKGSLSAQADISLMGSYSPKGEIQIRSPRSTFFADLSQMELVKTGLLQKPKAVPLAVSMIASGSERAAAIEKVDFRFANLALTGSGIVRPQAGEASSLSLEIPRTSLSGWEKYFPVLSENPAQGFIQVSAKIEGDIHKPQSLLVQLKPLLLEKIRLHTRWISEDKTQKLSGPIQADGRIVLDVLGTEVKSAQVLLSTDLSGIEAEKTGILRKKAGLPLTLNFSLGVDNKKSKNLVKIQSSELRVGSSRVALTGELTSPVKPEPTKTPHFNLKIQSPGLNLTELSELMPPLKEYRLTGSAKTNLNISGVYDFEGGIEKSPLRVSGDLNAKIPRYQMIAASQPPEAAPTQTTAPPTVKAPEPLLPQWPIAQSAELKAQVEIGEFIYDDLSAKGIQINSTLSKGQLSARADVKSVFSGSVNLNSIGMNLSHAQPDINGKIRFANIRMQEALGFVSKDWKEQIKGLATGDSSFLLPHTSRSDFLERIQAKGSIRLRDAFFSTMRLDELINDSLAKIPGVGSQKKVNTKGVSAQISAGFSLAKTQLQLSDFHFLTPENNELKASGRIGFDQSIDLKGVAHLASAPVGGSVREANSDPKGRFVVPLRIQGNLSSPKASFASETVSQILKNTAENETKKATDQLKQKAKDETKKQVDKLKDDLKKKGLEGLKDLFK